MERIRSVSESQSRFRRDDKVLVSPEGRKSRSSVSSASLTSLHNSTKFKRDSVKESLLKVLEEYKFLGRIVNFRHKDAYGFIRSSQVTGEVFFGLNHLESGGKDVRLETLIGQNVRFNVKDMGKKSIEARKVVIDVSPCAKASSLKGTVMSWTFNGCLIQVTSELGLQYLNNRIFAPFEEVHEIESGFTGDEVSFEVHVDRSFKLEGRNVIKTAPTEDQEYVSKKQPRLRRVTEGDVSVFEDSSDLETLLTVKNFTDEEFSNELVHSVQKMEAASLSAFFDSNLKSRLAMVVQQLIGCKIVVAVIKRASELDKLNVEEKIIRIINAHFLEICISKQGCVVIQAALDYTSRSCKVLLAEQLLELDSVDHFTQLWLHGSSIFEKMLSLLDESSLTTVGLTLLGNYISLSCHIRHYKPVRALLISIIRTDAFEEVLGELEEDLLKLSGDKFGHFIVSTLIQHSPSETKVRLIGKFTGKVASFSVHPECHLVIVTALEEGSDKMQASYIEEVCTVSNKQADMSVMKMTANRYGHLVVLAMLRVSQHKQVHNLLKASILCKQEDVANNEYAVKVLKAIKMEYHNRSVGNYAK